MNVKKLKHHETNINYKDKCTVGADFIKGDWLISFDTRILIKSDICFYF